MLTLTPDERILADAIRDDLGFISHFMQIPSKAPGAPRVNFVPRKVQARIIRQASRRNIVVKDSQVGATSIITALFMKRTITVPDTTSIIVAHEEFLTQRLLQRAQVFYDSIPEQLKPRMDHRSSSEKRFPDINSVMYIGTARSMVFGRGEPIHNMLFSEEAFYVEGAHQRVVLPSLQRVPPEGLVFRESTPNGEAGAFYDEVQLALGGNSTFRLHTMYWWENVDNYLRTDSEIAQDVGLVDIEYNEEERVLVEEHELSEDQIRWRRWKIMETGAMFWQEHLESLDTCFLTVGEPYYDPNVTAPATRKCYKAPFAGPGGAVVWFKPEEDGVYLMGIDPGEGKQTESVAHIWRIDLDHPRHEARISGLYEPMTMALKCIELGTWYNYALAIPEANAHGLSLINTMRFYSRMYFRKDIVSGVVSQQMGWLTSGRTKPTMMQELQRRLPSLESYDAEFWRQVSGFRELGMGKVGSITADDHHDAGTLTMVGMMGVDPYKKRGYTGGSGWNW